VWQPPKLTGPDSVFQTVETLEQIKARIEAAVPGARLEIVANDSPSDQRSLLLDNGHAAEVAHFLRDSPELRFDYSQTWPEWTGPT